MMYEKMGSQMVDLKAVYYGSGKCGKNSDEITTGKDMGGKSSPSPPIRTLSIDPANITLTIQKKI
jgi:hypothetical protein